MSRFSHSAMGAAAVTDGGCRPRANVQHGLVAQVDPHCLGLRRLRAVAVAALVLWRLHVHLEPEAQNSLETTLGGFEHVAMPTELTSLNWTALSCSLSSNLR